MAYSYLSVEEYYNSIDEAYERLIAGKHCSDCDNFLTGKRGNCYCEAHDFEEPFADETPHGVQCWDYEEADAA